MITPRVAERPSGTGAGRHEQSSNLGGPFKGAARNTGTQISPDLFTRFSDVLGDFDPGELDSFPDSRGILEVLVDLLTVFSRIDFPPLLRKGGKWILDDQRSVSGWSPTAT